MAETNINDNDNHNDPRSSDDGEQTAGAETIQGGDLHENPPLGTSPATSSARPFTGPVVIHRALTKENLRAHAEAVAKGVHHLENALAAVGLEPDDADAPAAATATAAAEAAAEASSFESLDEAEREARVREAALYVGNPVLAKPETSDFRPGVLWAISRALRPKLVVRHHGVTPEV